jgi:hypothetical protein
VIGKMVALLAFAAGLVMRAQCDPQHDVISCCSRIQGPDGVIRFEFAVGTVSRTDTFSLLNVVPPGRS